KLYRTEIAGGAPQEIANAPQGRGGSWNQDGVIIFAPTLEGLKRGRASGGQPEPLTKVDPPRSINHRNPCFLPDGRHFLFFAQGQNAIYLGTLDGANSTQLIRNDTAGAFVPPDRLLYVKQGGVLTAQRLD